MRERETDPDFIDTQDDGEPPSLRPWGDRYFDEIDPDYVGLIGDLKLQQSTQDREIDRNRAMQDRALHQTPAEAQELRYSERSAVRDLTAIADKLLAQYDVKASTEGDARIQHGISMLTRRTSTYYDNGTTVDKSLRELHAYFYIEARPGFEPRCRSWTSISKHVNWCDTDREFEPATAVSERLAVSFPERASSKESYVKRFGRHIMRRMMPMPTAVQSL